MRLREHFIHEAREAGEALLVVGEVLGYAVLIVGAVRYVWQSPTWLDGMLASACLLTMAGCRLYRWLEH